MKVKPTPLVWRDGQLVPWEQATVHVASHSLHYGGGIFSGGRCYRSEKYGQVIFRLPDHARRLVDSCHMYYMGYGECRLEYSAEELASAIVETVAANRLVPCYIRPLIIRGYGELGVSPLKSPVQVFIFVQDWGQYVGGEAGARVCISPYRRMRDDMMPMAAKCTANYANGQLIKAHAILHGYDEGIALTHDGYVSEGSGENVFFVTDGVLHTPDLGSSILNGIMRRTVITLARDLGYEVREERVPVSMFTLAEEVFFTGSAAEITPIGQIDRHIFKQAPGPVTSRLKEQLFAIINGDEEDSYQWLTPVTLS